jgi:hypothetical protein
MNSTGPRQNRAMVRDWTLQRHTRRDERFPAVVRPASPGSARRYTRRVRILKAQAPDGATWEVRVVWQPRWAALARRFGGWRRKRRGRDVDVSSGLSALTDGGGHHGGGWLDNLGEDLLVGLAVIVALVVFGVLSWWLLLPLLLAVVDGGHRGGSAGHRDSRARAAAPAVDGRGRDRCARRC